MDREYNIPIEPQVYERLEEQSREEHRSPAEIVNDMLKRQQLLRTMEKLQHEVELHAKAIGWNSEEDVFREMS
jgi:predicted CopG family antitoxin